MTAHPDDRAPPVPWLRAGVAAIVLSVVAVGALHASLPSPVRAAAEAIASPGEFLWWSTLGGAFAGYPVGVSGMAVWIGGTAAFWFVVFAAGAAVIRRMRHAWPD